MRGCSGVHYMATVAERGAAEHTAQKSMPMHLAGRYREYPMGDGFAYTL
jgi:hypothetical protein